MKYKVGPATPEQHSDYVYTPEMHAANLELVENALEKYGTNDSGKIVTPWLAGSIGLVAIEKNKKNISTLKMVETRDEGFYGLGAHFVDNKIVLKPDCIKANSKIWPPFHQRMGIRCMNVPISAGMLMGYPFLMYKGGEVITSKIDQTLSDPTLEPAQLHNLPELFTERPIDLKFRVGVKL